MVKLSYLKLMLLSLIFVLAACRGAGEDIAAVGDIAAEEPAVEGENSVTATEAPVTIAAATVLPTHTPTQAPTAPATVTPAPTETAVIAEVTEPTVEETAAGEGSPEMVPAGPSEQAQLLASLASKGAAPELFNEVWLNSEPLKLADLRGKVVIVEFWTYG
jgi:predicted small secreted protein